MYADYTDYQNFYGMDRLQEADFPRFAVKAQILMDQYTTGVDNVRKLSVAFPTDEDTVFYIKVCFCEVTDILYEISEAERLANLARGYEVTSEGIRGKVISSRSAGNESVSYGTTSSNGSATAMDKAISDLSERDRMIGNTIRRYLSGRTDANGVNLMYMGRYPRGLCTEIP